MAIFEITSDDIALLNDKQLRALVGRLCEAELQSQGYSESHATWGGNQNAPDGGIDVRVSLESTCKIQGFIPRPSTGYQVKAEDLTPTKVEGEMRPKGSLRPSISCLAEESGAYIIVSSKGSTADTALNARRNAMRDAVADCEHADQLHLDFFDRERIASWVRRHPGLQPWVREEIGNTIPGWQAYGNWASPESRSYLLDDKSRIYSGTKEQQAGLSALDGIEAIRSKLHTPGAVVRLVGLSGVGKTRLAQALFESEVGANPLPPTLAIYANMADDPAPSPTQLVDCR